MNNEFDFESEKPVDASNERIAKLEQLIQKYQNSYYNGDAEISDAQFDLLWDELKSLDPDNDLFQKVGADSGSFSKKHHVMPMGSQEKAADPEQFLAWTKNHDYTEYLVEYKLDGASLELQYVHGKLTFAVTRGDGVIGDDITVNARKMAGVISTLYDENKKILDYTGGIRGEVIMTHEIHDKYYSDKANCRNAANGLMKRKDGSGSENLELITYDAFPTDSPAPFSDEEEKINWLKLCGFKIVPLKICHNPQEVISYRAEVMELRATLEYDIDGLVIKERAINIKDAERTRPDRQIAFKFSLQEAVSTIRNVEWSESGATYTPVAVFDAVSLAGTTVQRASLANPDTIDELGLQIGSRVVVVKRGEIIPKIESVLPENYNQGNQLLPVVFPQVCSTCGTKLVNEGSRLYCPNKKCSKRVLHQLQKWISVVDIRDLGDTLIRALFTNNRVRSISDIYTLTVSDLLPYFLGEESIAANKDSLGAQKVIDSINSHRKMSLSVFVAGFDIEGIGETTVEKLVAAGFSSLDRLLDSTEEQLASVYGFAEIMARTAVKGFSENKAEMTALVNSGIVQLEQKNDSGLLNGKSFCFTGELETMKRMDAEQLVKTAGGSCKSTVTKDLSYLVTNDTTSGSAKNLKAAQFGIPIITEKEFIELINQKKVL